MSTWFAIYGFAEVRPGLVLGAYPLDAGDVETLAMIGIARVLNLVEDSEYQPGDRDEVVAALAAHGIAETRMALVDFGRLPADRIEEAVSTLVGWMTRGERSYVHCRAGRQRSAAVAAGAVAVLEAMPVEDALRVVRLRRETADPLPHQRADLIEWWMHRSPRPTG